MKHERRLHSVTNEPAWHRCEDCDKRTYTSRSDAKRIARRVQHFGKMHAYACEGGNGWHVGRLAPAVTYGQATRAEVYGARAAAHWQAAA